MKGVTMNKLVLFCIVFLMGAFLFSGTTEAMDQYYDNLDDTSPVLAAHKKLDNGHKDLLRKRAYKRKRIRRPPQRGK